MDYLTFFQLLRRCLLMDAAEHPPPRLTWKNRLKLAMEKDEKKPGKDCNKDRRRPAERNRNGEE